MQHIKSILNKYIQKSGLSKDIETALVIKEFEKLLEKEFGTNIGKKAKPLYIKNKILTVACLSSVMVQEINFKKDTLINKINQNLKKEALKDIKFTL